MNTENKKKVALISGATGGIGREIAISLWEKGYTLALTARSENKLQTLSYELAQNDSSRLTTHVVDLQSHDQIERLVQDVINQHGQIDLVSHNAGIAMPGTLELNSQELKKLFDCNFHSAHTLYQHIVPHMKERGCGHIITLASKRATRTAPGKGGYAASKFALRALSLTLAEELAPFGIRVTAISPSWVNTSMAEKASLESEEMIQPKDIAHTVNYLLSLGRTVCINEIQLEAALTIETG